MLLENNIFIKLSRYYNSYNNKIIILNNPHYFLLITIDFTFDLYIIMYYISCNYICSYHPSCMIT